MVCIFFLNIISIPSLPPHLLACLSDRGPTVRVWGGGYMTGGLTGGHLSHVIPQTPLLLAASILERKLDRSEIEQAAGSE